MAVLMITYDLKQPGRDYDSIHKYIKDNFTWCKGLESVWLVDTHISPSKIRDDLKALADKNDVIFVAALTNDWASYNYFCGQWLNKPERRFAALVA